MDKQQFEEMLSVLKNIEAKIQNNPDVYLLDVNKKLDSIIHLTNHIAEILASVRSSQAIGAHRHYYLNVR